jgi:hypothetical protein
MEMLFNKDLKRTTSLNETPTDKSEHQNVRSWGDWVCESASEAYAVVKDLSGGAGDELINHPLRVAEQAAMGAGIAAGFARLSPKIAFPLGAVGVTAAGDYLDSHSGNWLKSAEIVAGLKFSTPQEVMAAHADLRELGAGITDLAAAALGGFLTSRAHGFSVEKFGLKSFTPFTTSSGGLSASRHIQWEELKPLDPGPKNSIELKSSFSLPSGKLKGVLPIPTGADGTPFASVLKDSPLPKSQFNPPKTDGASLSFDGLKITPLNRDGIIGALSKQDSPFPLAGDEKFFKPDSE